MNHLSEVILTATLDWRDGVPYSALFQDIYHSKDVGLDEARYVFLQANQLLARFEALRHQEKKRFVIAEAGFGTGKNFLLTVECWLQNAPVDAELIYYSAEQYPLSLTDLQQCLALWPALTDLASSLIEQYPVLTPGFHGLKFKAGRIHLVLMLGDVVTMFQQLLRCGDPLFEPSIQSCAIDAWYLDGFSPAKNAAMWRDDLFQIMRLLSHEQTTVSTYSAAAIIKERFSSHGFTSQRVLGFASKKHMLVAHFDTNFQSPVRRSRLLKTPWHLAPVVNIPSRKAMVIGAGLAGCFIAHDLAQRGWEVTVFDEHASPGQGASGNRQAILYPKFSAYQSPLIGFMLSAYLFAQRLYQPLVGQAFEGRLNGMLQLATSSREIAAHERLGSWLKHYSELGRLVDAEEASQLTGVTMKSGGLYVPHSGWIDSQSLCEYLIQHPLIRFCGQVSIDTLNYHDNHWVVQNDTAPVLVIANGYAANRFAETRWLPIKAVAGQMTYFSSSPDSAQLQIPVCGQGHILPQRNQTQAFGATYHLNTHSFIPQMIDDYVNAKRLQDLPIDGDWDLKPIDHWSGIRAAAPDYLPLVGAVAQVESFNHVYKGLAADSRHYIAGLADHYAGLYVMTGFGSRGLTTVPLASEILAGIIHEEPTSYANNTLAALSPSRFLRQGLISRKNKV